MSTANTELVVYRATDTRDGADSMFAVDKRAGVMYVSYWHGTDDPWLADAVDMNQYVDEPLDMTRIGDDAVLLRGGQ